MAKTKAANTIGTALAICAVACAVAALSTKRWMLHQSKDEGTAYIGLLKVKECFIGEGCEKIKIANSDYNDFSSGGKTGFILLILGSMALCLSAAYLAMNSCNKRMEHSGVHHCLKSHAMLGSLLIACAWILWLVLSPHPPNFHLGLSFMLAVLGSALGLAAYVISIAVKQDSYKALA